MDKLKELLAAKRKAAEEEFGGKKYAKRAEIEELRLAKLRAEEAKEREAKVSQTWAPAGAWVRRWQWRQQRQQNAEHV